MERFLLISLGGAIGTGLRYLTPVLTARWLDTQFPYGTLIVNLSGPFVIGLIQQVGTEMLLMPDNLRLFLTTGLLGGFTTYPAFSYETVRLIEVGDWHRACVNVFVTTTLSLSLCSLGIALGRLVLVPGVFPRR